MKIAVIGAGNGGQAIAGYCASQGYSVCLYDRSIDALTPFISTKRIKLTGAISLEGRLDVITQDICEAINYSKLIFVVTTATAHREIAEQIAPYLTDDQTIILNPGIW